MGKYDVIAAATKIAFLLLFAFCIALRLSHYYYIFGTDCGWGLHLDVSILIRLWAYSYMDGRRLFASVQWIRMHVTCKYTTGARICGLYEIETYGGTCDRPKQKYINGDCMEIDIHMTTAATQQREANYMNSGERRRERMITLTYVRPLLLCSPLALEYAWDWWFVWENPLHAAAFVAIIIVDRF